MSSTSTLLKKDSSIDHRSLAQLETLSPSAIIMPSQESKTNTYSIPIHRENMEKDDGKNGHQRNANPSRNRSITLSTHSSSDISTSSQADHKDKLKVPNTPRTVSHTSLSLSGIDEPFRFDSDVRCASQKSLECTPEDDDQPKKLSNSPDSSIFTGGDLLGSTPSRVALKKDLKDHSLSTHRPLHEELDPDLSIDSSSHANSPRRYQSTQYRVDPPAYVSSGNVKVISPIDFASPYNKFMSRNSHKVKPVVYSAIGSLESVNQTSLGSFNHKLHMAAKKKNKKKQVDVDATTSRISRRTTQSTIQGEITQSSRTDLHLTLRHSNVAIHKSTLTSTLASKESHTESKTENRDEPLAAQNVMMNKTIKSNKNSNDKLFQDTSSRSGLKSECKKSSQSTNPTKYKKRGQKKKRVTIDSKPKEIQRVELFRPSCDAYTPRMGKKEIKYKPAEQRLKMDGTVVNKMGTIQKPNFQDALRRVAMIMQQHIVKIERRFASGADHLDLFEPAMRDVFAEENFVTPRYKCTMVKIPMARAGVVYGMRKIRIKNSIPNADDIYEFGHRLFKQVQLSSECSIICLIYVERIMEIAKVPVLANTWKPIFMCGLLLASKVWQDWSSWNIEFANVYPQFSLEAINKLELQFLKMVKWDLYISSSLYAKYYFALRSLLEKPDFRRRYNRMVGGIDSVSASQALKISKRTELLKEKSLAILSKSV